MPNLATRDTCTGCSACSNICPHSAISIRPDSLGFLMPDIDENKCVECKVCEKACPIVNGINIKHPEVSDAYAFWDNETRTQSSSGGAFSAIARWVRQRNGIVFGASWSDGFHCNHIGIDDTEDISPLRGSKYLQSDIKKTFIEARDWLRKDKYVLFTGTPCQIAGLRSFLMKPYENLITVDIVCHGVPSNVLFLNYISKLKKEFKKYDFADGFEFRNRLGWGYSPTLLNHNTSLTPLFGEANLYMAAFEKTAICRESCYDCHFNGLSRVGDLTIADFWGIGKQGKAFKQDVTKGVSLILINSEKGQNIINELKDCFIEKRDLEEALKFNLNIMASSKKPSNRENIIEAFNNPDLSLKEINKQYKLTGIGVKKRLRDFLIKMGIFWQIKSIVNKIKSV